MGCWKRVSPLAACRNKYLTVTEKMCEEWKGETAPCGGEGEEAKADPCGDTDNMTCRICLSDYKARRTLIETEIDRSERALLGQDKLAFFVLRASQTGVKTNVNVIGARSTDTLVVLQQHFSHGASRL